MALPSNVVRQRAGALARTKLLFDLLLAAAFYVGGAPLPLLIAPAVDVILLLPYLRYVQRAPAALTLGSLTLSAALLALAPYAVPPTGVVLWLLFPLVPMLAAYVLGRRHLVWRTTVITTLVAAVAAVPLLRSGEGFALDFTGLVLMVAAMGVAIWGASWLTARTLQADPGSPDILGRTLIVVRGVLVVPFNWVVGGVSSDALQVELAQLRGRHNPRWIVLDLAPAGALGRHDLNAIDRAAAAVSTPQCPIVLARPPVDAMDHLDVARPMVGRVERFATVPQAVEAGLRRLGWINSTEQRVPDPLSLIG